MATKHLTPFAARRRRVRTSLLARSGGRPRLSVHRSQQHIYVQVIDDAAGRTLAAASSLEKDFAGSGATVAAAQSVGKLIAERASQAGIKQVVFDRGGYVYTGRVAELAAGAREAGLEF